MSRQEKRGTIQILRLLLFTLLLAVPALGQTSSDRSKFAVFVDAGVAIPHGDLNTFLDPGFSLNTGLEYMITPQFSAEGIFGYHRFSTFFGGNTNLYQLSGNGKFYVVDESTRLRPFVDGGAGAYVTDSATTHFGVNVGGGVLYEATPKVAFRGGYKFHNVFTGGTSVKFSSVQAGVRFRF
jgi:opacity protein-like surface antigen